MSFFKNQLSKYLRSDLIPKAVWLFFGYTVFLFFFSALVGWFFYNFNQEMVSTEINELFTSMAWLGELGSLTILIIIFLNNLIKAWLAMLSGLFLGLGPAIFIIINGFFLGIVGFSSITILGWERTLALLLPHGLIELTIVFLAAAWGFYLGQAVLLWLVGKKEKQEIKQKLKMAWFWSYKVLPLWILIATIVEVFITPLVDYLIILWLLNL